MPEIQDFIKIWGTKPFDALSFLLKQWLFILLAILLGGAVGYYKTKSIQPTYTANITFVLSTESKSSNALAGLASQLGFDATTSGSESIFSGDNIIELFKSRSLIGSALQSVVDSTYHQTLLNYIAQREYKAIFKKIGPLGNDPQKYNQEQTNLYRNIITYVSSSFVVYKKDKKLIFYIISATSTNADIANYIAKYILDQTSRYFIDTKTKVSATTVVLLKHEADSLGMVLRNAYNSTASVIDRTYNLNPSMSVQRSGTFFNQAKASAFASAYTEVMRNLEIAKINLQKETPLYKIIDEPELPLAASEINKTRHIILTSIVGLIFMLILLMIEYLYITTNKINENHSR